MKRFIFQGTQFNSTIPQLKLDRIDSGLIFCGINLSHDFMIMKIW